MKRLGKFEIQFAGTCEAVEPVGLTLFKINVFQTIYKKISSVYAVKLEIQTI